MQNIKLICPVCEFENSMELILCDRCGAVLRPETRRMASEEDAKAIVPKLGAQQVEKRLYLHLRGGKEFIEVELEEGTDILVGRHDPSMMTIPAVDLTQHRAAEFGVSRRHAMLTYQEEILKVTDLDSANHTFLNGRMLVPYQARILRDGDELRFGHLIMTVQFSA
jgi:hypothetical protein